MSTKEVVLSGGSPWGFRMHGGSDTGQPLRISRVNPGSKAAQKGVREGDVISSINGQTTRCLTNSESHALLRNAGQSLRLGLNEDCGGSPKRRNFKMTSETPNESSKKETKISTVGDSKAEAQLHQKGRRHPEEGQRSRRARRGGKRKAKAANAEGKEAKNDVRISHGLSILFGDDEVLRSFEEESGEKAEKKASGCGEEWNIKDAKGMVCEESREDSADEEKNDEIDGGNVTITGNPVFGCSSEGGPNEALPDEPSNTRSQNSEDSVENNSEITSRELKESFHSFECSEWMIAEEFTPIDYERCKEFEIFTPRKRSEAHLTAMIVPLSFPSHSEHAFDQDEPSKVDFPPLPPPPFFIPSDVHPVSDLPRPSTPTPPSTPPPSVFSTEEPQEENLHQSSVGTFPSTEEHSSTAPPLVETSSATDTAEDIRGARVSGCRRRRRGGFALMAAIAEESNSDGGSVEEWAEGWREEEFVEEEIIVVESREEIGRELFIIEESDEDGKRIVNETIEAREEVVQSDEIRGEDFAKEVSSMRAVEAVEEVCGKDLQMGVIQESCNSESVQKWPEEGKKPSENMCIELEEACDEGLECSEEITKAFDAPDSLLKLCLKRVLEMPYGAEIVRRIWTPAEWHRSPAPSPEDRTVDSKDEGTLWVPVPTHGPLNICLTPKQLEGFAPSPEQAARLLDMHVKFSERRGYHEGKASQIHSEGNAGEGSLLSDGMGTGHDEDEHRLQTRVLSEWLTLARSAESRPSKSQAMVGERQFDADKYRISKRGDIAIEIPLEKRPVSMPPGSEIFRQQMYTEYMNKVAERAERKQQKVIKLSAWGGQDGGSSCEERFVNEFMGKVKQRMDRMGMKEEESETKNDSVEERKPSFTIEGGLTELPKHLKDDTDLLLADDGVWSPSKSVEDLRTQSSSDQIKDRKSEPPKEPKEDVAPIWVPKSAGPSPTLERKEFKPVNFDLKAVKTKKTEESGSRNISSPKPEDSYAWSSKSTLESTSKNSSAEIRSFIQSPTSPSSGSSIPPFSSRLPRAQNPTITLLQKAREGQLPKGAHYLDEKEMISSNNEPELMYMKKEYETEDEKRKRKIVELGPKKFDGIGPTTKDGIPIVLRSGIKEENQGKWYRKMYDSLHRTGKDDEYVTVHYKTRRGQYPYTSAEGYLSEPDHIGYDSDMGYSTKYATLDRRRIKNKDYNFSTCTMPRSKYIPPLNKYETEIYKNQPGRIEDYEPGHSSIAEKEAKLHDSQTHQLVKPYMSQALKESGYESDSTLLFKRREENIQSLSPMEQKQAYKNIQMGGEVPLHGLRKPAPERPKEPVIGPVPIPKGSDTIKEGKTKESPHKYVESEVTIHYRSPIRAQAKEALPEEELARRQEEAMRRIYQEERRRKYLQELQDMESRRHTDNFTPSQKSPIPLNRYDNFLDEVPSKIKGRDQTPEPKVVARALYNFVGQSSRELSFKKGDIIFVRRQIDKNWYEGEHNAMIGLFPFNYVEIIPYDGIRTMPKRPTEGQARAKYNFVAQTHLELSLIKGELVVLTRRVDNNWFEGRIGNRKGIFPISYVEVLVEPGDRPVTPSTKSITSKLAASPVSSILNLNGSNVLSSNGQPYTQQYLGKQQCQYHAPNSIMTQKTPYVSSPGRNPYSSKTRSTSAPKLQLPSVNQTLHIDTHSDPVPYRALYNYKPQNEDELELQEGDTVYVMEKCDDGWYVGSSHRTGYFGTFPGNYVERI